MGLIDLLKKAFMEGYATSSITIGSVLMCIGCTVAIAVYIFAIYKIVNRNSFYNKGFNISLVIIAVITASSVLFGAERYSSRTKSISAKVTAPAMR